MSSGGYDLFPTCAEKTAGMSEGALLQCVSDALQQEAADRSGDLVHWLLIIAGALVFFMQAGFAMICAGCVRKKNVQNTMLKNLLDACGAGIAFYCVGYAFAFGGQNEVIGTTFMGTSNFFLMGDVDPSFWFFQFAFSCTSVTIVAGTLAERSQMAAYLCYSLFLTGFVYPIVVHAVWSNNGFLSSFSATPSFGSGAIDFAGSGVVHLTGGTTSLIATYILGARRGRFTDSRGRKLDKPREFPGHSMALQLMGTLVLWFGWYGFNPGSALLLTATKETGKVAALVAANTSLAGAAGAISGLVTNLYLEERKTGEFAYSLTMSYNGCLAGLVAITAPCGTVEMWASVVIGIVAGWVYIGGSKLLLKLQLDDAVDAIPVHMFNGIWGLIATGLFSAPSPTMLAFGQEKFVGLFYSFGSGDFNAYLLANQALEIAFILGWTTATMGPFFIFLNYMGWFRSDSLEELVGLDFSYHGGTGDSEEEVKDEHVKAFKRQKGKLRSRRSSSRSTVPADAFMDDNLSWTDLTMTSKGPERARDTKSIAGLSCASGASGYSGESADEESNLS